MTLQLKMSLSDVLSTWRSKYDGRARRTSCDTTTRSVPLMMTCPGRHEREVTHEDRLALDLARAVVDELGGDEHGRRVVHVLVLALLDGVLGRLEPVVPEREGHSSVKSSIGLISSKISSSPDCSGTSFTPASCAASTRERQRSLPSSQSQRIGLQGEEVGTQEVL